MEKREYQICQCCVMDTSDDYIEFDDKGICSRCGKNLNKGSCGCAEEPKDPRMAAISDIFSKFKEV